MTDALTALAKLREPFPDNQISKLPKETRAQIDARKADKSLMVWKCPICGGPHHKNAVHLDYVGHAALTDRLLDADPLWTWDPVPDPVALGFPVAPGGMWIKLTVANVSRYGFGCADGKSGGDAVKEIIGDALRNAAMRFGAALDLWHKGDLHSDEEPIPRHDPTPREDNDSHDERVSEDDRAVIMTLLEKTGADTRAFCQHFGISSLAYLPAARVKEAIGLLEKKARGAQSRQQQTAPARNVEADVLDNEIPY